MIVLVGGPGDGRDVGPDPLPQFTYGTPGQPPVIYHARKYALPIRVPWATEEVLGDPWERPLRRCWSVVLYVPNERAEEISKAMQVANAVLPMRLTREGRAWIRRNAWARQQRRRQILRHHRAMRKLLRLMQPGA